MTYNEHVGMWNDIANYGLTKSQIPNYEVVVTPRITPFWQTMQNALRSHYQTFHIAFWDINNKMSVEIADDKHHLNNKTASDNLNLTRCMSDNRVGIVNHTVALFGCNLILWA